MNSISNVKTAKIYLKTKILNNEYKIGSKLPSERELTQLLNIPKTSLHSAIDELASAGFIKKVNRQGNYVNDYFKNGNSNTINELIEENPDKFSKDTYNSILEFRHIIQAIAVKYAVNNRDEEDLKIMKQTLNKINNETDINKKCKDIYNFHHSIYCSTHNPFIALLHSSFEEAIKRFDMIALNSYELHYFDHYYQDLYEAILKQNMVKAITVNERLMHKGINIIKNELLKNQ